MNDMAPSKLVTTDRTAASKVAMAGTGQGASIRPESLGDVVRFAELMCQSKAGIPSYLHGNAADCMAITLQALQWEFNPFSVAQKSYKVKDVIAYEAQLIAAVVNTRSGIKGRLKYSYEGEGDSLQCTVTGILDGEEYSYTSPRFDQITPKNSPLWKTDPKQQIGYYSARAWARRYTPEVILGVYDRDEAQQFHGAENAKDVTPLQQRLAAARTATEDAGDAQEGFSMDHVNRETETRVSDDPEEHQSDAPPASDEGDESPLPPSSPSTLTEAAPSPVEASDESGGDPPSPSLSPIQECAVKILGLSIDPLFETPQQRRGALERSKNDWKASLPVDYHGKLKALVSSADAIIKGDVVYSAAVEFYADQLEMNPDRFPKEDA